MTRADELFLAVMAAALRGEPYSGPVKADDAEALFREAEEHSVLPLVVEAVYQRPELRGEALKEARSRAVMQVVRQMTQDNEFLVLLEKLQAESLDPLVIKGMICRELYPKPFLRPSVDEDIFVPEADFAAYVERIPALGMYADQPEADPREAFELSFHKKGSPLYVELHKSLFAPDSEAYRDLNLPFGDVLERTTAVTVQGMPVRTLDPTDHLLYLILHAFKHFLYSGFGIRYVCDIVLFAEHYRAELAAERVVSECQKLRADRFAAAVFRIGTKHLGMDPSAVPDAWRDAKVDEAPLLDDILSGGLYGIADENRLHSSGITLNARAGGGSGSGILRSLFPSAEYLRSRFPYARKHPVLLPVAWAHRILQYVKRSTGDTNLSASESVRIGQERVRLMERYGVIG